MTGANSDNDDVEEVPHVADFDKQVRKRGQLTKLPTLDDDTAIEPEVTLESAADTILDAAKFVLGLSAYIDGELLRRCSGILIDWSEGTGTILTTAWLICSMSPYVDDWLGGKEYALNAEVLVQLLYMDDTEVKGKLVYLDKQYCFALINAPMDQPTNLVRFSKEVKFSQNIFLLGRDKWDLQIGEGKVLSDGAGSRNRHHLMFTDGDINPCGVGGAVIDLEGDVLGMINDVLTFMPSSTILKCLHLWRTFDCVPRIHFGMKFLGIKCLNLFSKEKISRKYNVDAGLIVVEVSGGSNAEKLGLRKGDIIQSVNGECIATAVELENRMLDLCKDHLEKGTGCGSDVDVMLHLDAINTTKRVRGKLLLTAKLSCDEEIVKRGEIPFPARDL